MSSWRLSLNCILASLLGIALPASEKEVQVTTTEHAQCRFPGAVLPYSDLQKLAPGANAIVIGFAGVVIGSDNHHVFMQTQAFRLFRYLINIHPVVGSPVRDYFGCPVAIRNAISLENAEGALAESSACQVSAGFEPKMQRLSNGNELSAAFESKVLNAAVSPE